MTYGSRDPWLRLPHLLELMMLGIGALLASVFYALLACAGVWWGKRRAGAAVDSTRSGIGGDAAT